MVYSLWKVVITLTSASAQRVLGVAISGYGHNKETQSWSRNINDLCTLRLTNRRNCDIKEKDEESNQK